MGRRFALGMNGDSTNQKNVVESYKAITPEKTAKRAA